MKSWWGGLSIYPIVPIQKLLTTQLILIAPITGIKLYIGPYKFITAKVPNSSTY
jgi:hypothetical protein